MKCLHCTSDKVHWFTPRRDAERAAVLLCMSCRRLTIVPTRARRTAPRTDSQLAAA